MPKCHYHANESGGSHRSPQYVPRLFCPMCRMESVRRAKRGEPKFFAMLDIARYEKEHPGESRVLRYNYFPAQRVLDALIEVCGEDLGRKKYHQLLDNLTMPDFDRETGEDIPVVSEAMASFLYGLAKRDEE